MNTQILILLLPIALCVLSHVVMMAFMHKNNNGSCHKENDKTDEKTAPENKN